MLFKGYRKLIGAGSRLKSALDAAQTLYSLLNRHSNYESGNALRVSGASSGEFCINYYAVLDIHIDLSGAYALSLISNVFHFSFPFSICI